MPAPLSAGSDIQATNVAAGLLQIAMLLQQAELTVPEETRPNNVTVSFDAEENTASVTATLPVTFTLDSSGQPVVTATDYIP